MYLTVMAGSRWCLGQRVQGLQKVMRYGLTARVKMHEHLGVLQACQGIYILNQSTTKNLHIFIRTFTSDELC